MVTQLPKDKFLAAIANNFERKDWITIEITYACRVEKVK
jgi:hypothetical protein